MTNQKKAFLFGIPISGHALFAIILQNCRQCKLFFMLTDNIFVSLKQHEFFGKKDWTAQEKTYI
ncbi:MAG TPA: hypothetical protein DEO95_08065 [Ruminococcaceae bacterium]|nr:hypothetical protein [Oscillospiraceae bacterium]